MRGERYLTKTAQYALVYSKGSSWADSLIVIKALPNGLDLSRFGLSVGRRVGKAVVRNKVKRRLREIMRKAPLKLGWDIVLIARPRSAGVSYHQLNEVINRLLCKAGLLAGRNEEACPRVD